MIYAVQQRIRQIDLQKPTDFHSNQAAPASTKEASSARVLNFHSVAFCFGNNEPVIVLGVDDLARPIDPHRRRGTLNPSCII